MTEIPISIQDKFWAAVDKSGECWLWTGRKMPNGYGRFNFYESIIKKDLAWVAHRFAWEILRGEIPQGLTLDHLCRVRLCVNPAHLEPVTNTENIRRGVAAITHCPQGHPYSPENTYISNGTRRCKTCSRERSKAKRPPRTRIPFGPCKVCGEIDKRSGGLGYCGYHYYRFKTYGDPLAWTRKRRKKHL